MGKYFKKKLSTDKENIIAETIPSKKESIKNIIKNSTTKLNDDIKSENGETINEFDDNITRQNPQQLSAKPSGNPMLFDIYQVVLDLKYEINEIKKSLHSIKTEIIELKENKPFALNKNIHTPQPSTTQTTISQTQPNNFSGKHHNKTLPNQKFTKKQETNKLEEIVSKLEEKEKITKTDIEKYLNKLNSEHISKKDLQEFVKKYPLEEIFPDRPKEAYKEAYKEVFNSTQKSDI